MNDIRLALMFLILIAMCVVLLYEWVFEIQITRPRNGMHLPLPGFLATLIRANITISLVGIIIVIALVVLDYRG